MNRNSCPLTRRAALALAAGTLLALGAGCAADRPLLRTDQDPAVDLRDYRRFAFDDAAAAPGTAAPPRSLLALHLERATGAALERQGYVRDDQRPELRVSIAVQTADTVELRSTPGRRGGYRGWGSGISTVRHREGTLVVELVDVSRNALVWQGVAEGRLDGEAAQRPAAAAERAVKELFARFPVSVARAEARQSSNGSPT